MNNIKVLDQSYLAKHTSVIHITNEVSLTARKIYNILLYKAFHSLKEKQTHTLKLSELVHMLGSKSRNYEILQDSLNELMKTTVNLNIFGKDKKNLKSWSATTLLAAVTIHTETNEVIYEYSSSIASILANPNIYAKLNLSIQSKFISKHSLAMWELFVEHLCSSTERVENSELIISVIDLRKILGLTDNEYSEFKAFKQKVITKSLEEINSKSDIHVEPDYLKEGKTIKRISFKLKYKGPLKNLPLINNRFNTIEDSQEEIIISFKDKIENKYMREWSLEFNVSIKDMEELFRLRTREEIFEAVDAARDWINSNPSKKLYPAGIFRSALKAPWTKNKEYKEINLNLFDVNNLSEHLQDQFIINDDLDKKWKIVLTKLKDKYGSSTCKSWFSKIEFINLNEKECKLIVPTNFIKDWIKDKYFDSIKELLEREGMSILAFEVPKSK